MPEQTIFTVSELNRDVRQLLERGFPLVMLEGEVSNFANVSSGHWYMSLKDSKAQVKCAMFRNRNRLVNFTPENGMHVLVRARVSLYEPRGDFQLILEHMEEAGLGALQRAYDELKARLQKEGLFDIAHKKDLPRMPRQIGVITSPTGAAIRDIVSVLGRRFPSIPVLIFPTLVQGEQAADQIVAQINKAVTRGDCDVLILARGGGSLEDLWPFNEEKVARAIHACPIPIVSGVGHEVDFTIADFVADKRAPTPSVAAEMVVPDGQEIVQALERRERQIIHAMRNKLKLHSHHFNQIFKHLQHPSRRLQIITQKVDELESRLTRSTRESLRQYERMLSVLSARLRQHNPAAEIRHQGLHIEQLKKRVINLMRQHLALQKSRLAEHSRGLETVSPLATLSRGYSILRDEKGQILRQSSQTRAGAVVHANLGEGALRLTVDEVMNE